MACRVNQRRHEIGIRMALGAQPGRVLAMVLCEAGLLIVFGLVAGIVGVLYLTRFLDKLLYRLKPNDPSTLLGSGLALAVVALVAAFVPARRAASIDPMRVLREE
jgi:ABC-type antimicrobial peptide transport system permease subunit